MKIEKVTITGADDNTDIETMVEISKQFPFVEWGILFSPKRIGEERYPNFLWLDYLVDAYDDHLISTTDTNMKLSAHLCGGYTSEMLMIGSDSLAARVLSRHLSIFSRRQLNFNASRHQVDVNGFIAMLKGQPHTSFIIQQNAANKALCQKVREQGVKNVAFLYDSSGGRGTVASEWKAPIEGYFTGYAGGLSPENLAAELEKIEKVAGDATIWIDTESRVRTNGQLDMEKVKQFLSIAEKYTK